jgi:hypothetical protein
MKLQMQPEIPTNKNNKGKLVCKHRNQESMGVEFNAIGNTLSGKADSNQANDTKQVFKDGVLDSHDCGNNVGAAVLIACEQ